MSGYEGFATLGDLVAGGPGRRAEAKAPGYMKESADGYSALDKAAQERVQRIALENAPDVYKAWATKQGMSPEAAALGANYSQRGNNFNTQMGGTQTLGDMELDRQTQERLEAGDVKGARIISAVKTDKVLPTLGAGGKVVFTPVDGSVDLTPLGTSNIAATDALIGQRNAGADAAQARAEHSRRPAAVKAPKQSRIATRAATMEEDLGYIEQEIGRPLTPVERADYLQGKQIKLAGTVKPLGEQAPSTTIQPHTKATHAFSQDEVQQAITDARRAVSLGKMTKAQAAQRLRDAGLDHAAGAL